MTVKATVGLMLACASAFAEEGTCRKVTIYVQGNRFASTPVTRASKIATAMFAATGIDLQWRIAPLGIPAENGDAPIVIRMTTGERVPAQPAAMAYALPFSTGGTSITVFWDQVQKIAGASYQFQDTLLAHVMVHEITHVLQGLNRHSGTGIMRESWTDRDYFEMKGKPLAFTSVDVEWIQAGLAKRTSRHSSTSEQTASGKRQTTLRLLPGRGSEEPE
jgi:hypothetical protein